MIGLPDDGRQPGILDAQIGQDHLVHREGVGAGVDVTHVGGTVATHHAEWTVGHRRPGIDDGEVGRATSSSIIVAERKSTCRPA